MLTELIKKRILIMDGAMGTIIQQFNLSAADYDGHKYEGCPEMLNVTRPEIIQDIHERYLKAGADIVETNTFGGTGLVLAEYSLAERMEELNRAAVKIAREAVNKYSTDDKPRFVCGSIGPTTKAYSVIGGITFDELEGNFFFQSLAILAEGVDLILIETCQDTVNIKAAIAGVAHAKERLGVDTPVMISVTIEQNGRMLAGQSIEAMYLSIAHNDMFSVGLNCATGPELMADHLRSISALSNTFVNVCPNAGMPNHEGKYDLSPEQFAKSIERFVDNGWVNIVGGCCGTSPDHISSLRDVVNGKKPRVPAGRNTLTLTGIDLLELSDDSRPVIVGERTNVIGSRKFKNMINEEKFEEAAEVGLAQVKGGAQIIDICLGNPDRDELSDIVSFMDKAGKKIKVPLMIDSTGFRVIETALKMTQGKCVINSINLENGEERFKEVVPLAKKYGAAMVVGTIDDDPIQGMGINRERKLEIARRSYTILTDKYGIRPEDIIFDPLVFPVGTGDKNYIGSAEETIEAIKIIKKEFPGTSTILGISNISFGLPPAGREVLNAVFLYHSTIAGLDFAIVNSEKLKRYASISEDERRLAEDLMLFKGDDPVNSFVAFYKDKKLEINIPKSTLTLEERLRQYIVEGTKDGMVEDLSLCLKKMSPIDIINGPLMEGMGVVGKLFNENKLIVAEVLQSAESMRAAVNYLDGFMDKESRKSKGKILLATVKGDVHDIGKNLVEIILSNNGYTIVNLGIKISPEALIQSQLKEKADAIGLSGLLVKSALQMIPTVEDLKSSGIDCPVLVGGAALTSKFTADKIQPAYRGPVLYARDAMDALTLADGVLSPETRDRLLEGIREKREAIKAAGNRDISKNGGASNEQKRKAVLSKVEGVIGPFSEIKVEKSYDLAEIFSYINPMMLFGKHLGLKGDPDKLISKGDKKAIDLVEKIESFKKEIISEKMITPASVCRFYPALSDRESIIIFDPDDPEREVERFNLPRQDRGEMLSIADYILPISTTGKKDVIGIFITTGGKGIREKAEIYKNKGEYLRSHALSAIALETAEALAEYLHKQMRGWLGFADPEGVSRKDLFRANYRGRRYSFGYPACPALEEQKKIFSLLNPELIDVSLTDEYMMDPEASVSAIVIHHPAAKYFSVYNDQG